MVDDGDLYVGGSEVRLLAVFLMPVHVLDICMHCQNSQPSKRRNVYKRGVCGISNPKDLYVSLE